MGEHEAEPTSAWARLREKLEQKAKAVWAGITVLVLGELVLVLSDADVLELIRQVVPAPIQPLIPVSAAALVYAVTHQVRNRPANTDDTSGDEPSAD